MVLAASALTSSGASAQPLRRDDGTGDAWRAVYDDQDVLSGWVPAGSPDNGDVVSTLARHAPRRISFTTHYVSLERGPGHNRFITQQQMVFDHGPGVSVDVDTTQGWDGTATLSNRRTGNGMQCAGLRHTVDYDADMVRVSFPRACVGRPQWLRYAGGAWALSGSATPSGDDDFNYLDNALNAGHRRGTGTANLSPRIHRG
jgi:hypothetical protein